MEKGKLYVIATPIGNTGDITLRALECLKLVDCVIAEDTREAGKLFLILELPKKPYISYRDQNHDRVYSKILDLLNSGKNLGLISDRGTPLISDPGYKLVRDLQEAGIEVVSVPGASSVTASLSISGLPTDRFTFLGFLPRSHGRQVKLLAEYADIQTTLVIFESPYRVIKTLETIKEVYGEAEVSVVNDVTKMHEKVYFGKITEVLAQLKAHNVKGEWVVLVRRKL